MNTIKNQLYPYTTEYINEYLHGFSKDKIDIQLSKGEVTLEKLSLRPDTINKIMDEQNLPFWIKVGLIKKIYLGASVLSVIGEIPLEIEIDGVDIILSPSYKWIIKNIEKFSKNNNNEIKDTPNPLGNDIFNKKPDDFDTSIFNVEKIQEIFKDKTMLSNVINSLFKSLYSFYTSPNFVAVIKIRNVHIRFEDDELMNYTGDIALGMRINLIQIKVGCKGNMKKDSIKLESLDIYWENDAKILISSNFLNSCIVNGQLEEKYYQNLKNVRFEQFQYLPTTKFIIQDFNMTMNIGTRNEKNENIDIFDIKTTPSMVYFQLASNELNVNIYPEIAKIQNNFTLFLSQFPIIEKVNDYRPFIKPSKKNSMDYLNLIENYKKNVIDSNNNNEKMLVRDWIYYFYWFQKSKNGEKQKIINPIRTEFVRFYNICIKKVDINEHKNDKEKEKRKKQKQLEKTKIKEKKEQEKENLKDGKVKIKNETNIAGNTPMGDNNIENNKNIAGKTPTGDEKEKENYLAGKTPMGDEKENENRTPGETPQDVENETHNPDEKTEKDGDEDEEEREIPKELDFSARIDLLIKGFNVNLHSPLNEKANDYICLSINGIEIKIKLTKEKFDLNFKIKTIDLGPSNLNTGQRVIIQPKSYRKAIPEQNMTSINSNIPYGNLSTYNYVSLPNSNLGSRITGLIKKYNPNHEQKIKVIDEALELAESNSRAFSLAPSEMGDYNKYRSPKKFRNKTPFGDNASQNLEQSTINLNVSELGKTYGSVFVPRNVSFAKNLIDNYEGNSLQNKKYERKKNNELNISQAINDYNSYKNQEKFKLRTSRSPPSSLSSSQFNLRESQFGITPNSIRGKNIPLNLLEIFSNTEVGAFSLKFTKYNNPVTIDNLSIQIGTIRLNIFSVYLLDILRILSEYKKATNSPKITTSEGDFSPDGKTILEIQEYFYNYLLKKIPDNEKTESMIEYMEYLRKEISSKKKFSSKPEHFQLNQIFSFFPKGFEFHFDYENIEVVAYDKDNIVSSKIIVPSSELILSLTFSKIFVKLLELEVEIADLNRCETIIEQLKDLAKDKFKVVQIVIEPCYKQIKDEINPLLKGNNSEYKQILQNQNSSNNIRQKSPQNKNINQYSPQNLNQKSPQNININQNSPQSLYQQSPQNININQNSPQNISQKSPQHININQNLSPYININQYTPQLTNIAQNTPPYININQNTPLLSNINLKDNSLLNINQNLPQNINIDNNSPRNINDNTLRRINVKQITPHTQNIPIDGKRKHIEEFGKNIIKEKNQIEEDKKKNIQQNLIQKSKEDQELLLRKQKENELLIQMQKEKELSLLRQQQEREKEIQIQIQKQKEAILNQQQLERQQKLLLLNQQQQQNQQQGIFEKQLLEHQKAEEKLLHNQQNQKKISLPPLHPQQKLVSQDQHKKQLLLGQQQSKNKNQTIKYSKKSVSMGKSPKISHVRKKSEEKEKIPKDSIRKNKNLNLNLHNSNSHSNIYMNNNNYNISLMKRENSNQNISTLTQFNPQIQQNIRYKTEANVIENNNNNIYNSLNPNLNNNGYLYQNNNQQNSYVFQGNNNNYSNNNSDSFNLLNNN